MTSRRMDQCGYTLIEVMIASALLAVGIAAAAILALTMTSQQEASARVARALNYQEQAGRLYQMGVSYGTITNILPGEAGVSTMTFDEADLVLASVGTVRAMTSTLVYRAGSLVSSAGSNSLETNVVIVIRPGTN